MCTPKMIEGAASISLPSSELEDVAALLTVPMTTSLWDVFLSPWITIGLKVLPVKKKKLSK